MLRGQSVLAAGQVVFDDAACDHGAEPLAHVALIEAGRLCYLVARGRRQAGHGVEQPGLVADAGQEHHGGAVQVPDHLPRERLSLRGVKLLYGHEVALSRLRDLMVALTASPPVALCSPWR